MYLAIRMHACMYKVYRFIRPVCYVDAIGVLYIHTYMHACMGTLSHVATNIFVYMYSYTIRL